MRRRKIDREILTLMFTTLLTVSTWVGTEVYKAYVKSYTPTDIEKFLLPVDPTVDKVFLDKLNLRYK